MKAGLLNDKKTTEEVDELIRAALALIGKDISDKEERERLERERELQRIAEVR